MKFIASVAVILSFFIFTNGCIKKDTPSQKPPEQKTEQQNTQNKSKAFDDTLKTLNTGLEVTDWGPQFTKAGTAFNAQPNGESALWFKLNGASSNISVFWESKQLVSYFDPASGLISANVTNDMFTKAGKYKITLIDAMNKLKSQDLIFVAN